MQRATAYLERAYSAADYNVKVLLPTDVLSRRLSGRSRALARQVEQAVLFPLRVMTSPRSDLYHLSDQGDASSLLLLRLRRPVVTTVHDLIAVRAARGELPGVAVSFRSRVLQRGILHGLRRSDALVAVSRETQKDVVRLVSSDCTLIPNPVARLSSSIRDEPAVPHDHQRPYVLVVGEHPSWRKRRYLAIETWLSLLTIDDVSLDLLIVGAALQPNELRSIPAPLRERVRVVSDVDDLDLARMYRDAEFLVHMALYEGFGWPIVEANLVGTPALCADVPVLRETGGDAAVYLTDNPSQVELSRALTRLSQLKGAPVTLANAGRFSFAQYTESLRAMADELLARVGP